LALATAGVTSCGEPDLASATPTPPAMAGLVVLAGDPGAATLTIHDKRGTGRTVSLPDPATAWISASGESTLMATLDDGTLRVSDRVGSDTAPTWTRTPDADVTLPPDPLRFATWAPGGQRVAALASDFVEGGQLTLAIVDPAGDASLLLPVPRQPLVAAPAWIDEQRVLVQTTVGFVVVDTGTGIVGLGPRADLGGGIGLAVAVEAGRIALAPEAGLVEIRDLAAWLAGDTGEADARIEDQGEIGSIAFDRSGERLAVVWQRPDGPGRLTIHRRSDGWRQAQELTLPGESSRAVVDFLP
jgi:hypothetical protein